MSDLPVPGTAAVRKDIGDSGIPLPFSILWHSPRLTFLLDKFSPHRLISSDELSPKIPPEIGTSFGKLLTAGIRDVLHSGSPGHRAVVCDHQETVVRFVTVLLQGIDFGPQTRDLRC